MDNPTTAPEVFRRIDAACADEGPIGEEFIRGLAGRSLGLTPRNDDERTDSWWRYADDAEIVMWWAVAQGQFRQVHPEVASPTDADVIGGQMFADRMSGDY